MNRKLIFTVPPEYDGARAIKFLKQSCCLSSRMIARLKREKDGILMDGKILRTVDSVTAGAEVEINLPNEKSEILPVQSRVEACFEDEHLLIVNKPPLTPVHPVKQYQSDTLANFVSFYSMQRGESYVFRAINRLDRNTSGLVAIAKDKFTVNMLKKNINKTYYALCHGNLEGEGTINSPIGLADGSKIVRQTREDGQPSITHYSSVYIGNDISFVTLTLETGRTHQIRCHMSSIGHPLLGDDLYGGSREKISRQALHCGKMVFTYPVSGEVITVNAPLPEDMRKIIKNTDIKTGLLP